jgi:hypothetical protein
LKNVSGALEWHGTKPGQKKQQPPETANHKAARGSVRAKGR